jgi:1-deoxyxylulose-5-phosphate synthase
VERRELGRSGISVTRVVLGCGNFGGVGSAPAFFGQGIPQDEARRIMDTAWELGIRAFDTADAYGGTRSETWIGEWLAARGSSVRDELVIQTKTFNPVEERGDRGLAPARIARQIDTSLARLGVERVGVYLAHSFDEDTPQEETLHAFDALVRTGKAGAIGASNFTAEQLAEAIEISELEGLVRYEVVQDSYSLLDRGDEETVLPVCREHGLGYEAFGPLAGGWLTGKYRRGEPYAEGSRMTQRPDGYRRFEDDRVFDGLEELQSRALGRGVSMAGLALAWLLGLDEVTAIVVGPTRAEHLDPVRVALTLELSSDELDHLRGLFP